nr:hypothetical protein [Tanacetum cinerariifolium]
MIMICYRLVMERGVTIMVSKPGYKTVGSKDLTCEMVNTRTDADLSAAVQNALQTLLPQIRAEIREEFRTSSGPLDSGGNPPPISHMEKIFDVMGCEDAFKTRLDVYKFEGNALAWWKAYKQAKGGDAWLITVTWAEFKKLFFLQFFPRVEQERLKRKYHSIRQTNTETSMEFMQRFLRLARFLGAAAGTEEELTKNFQWGLPRIPPPDGKVLRVLGERLEGKSRFLMGAKVGDNKKGEIVVVRDIPEVFPNDLSGLPPIREIKFQIKLIPEATPVAKSPYHLVPSELSKNSKTKVSFDQVCLLGERREVQFLGHVINGNEIHVDPSKIEAVKNWKAPRTPTEGEEQELTFQTLKNKLCNAPVLALPDRPKNFVVYCDASEIGLGCVLMQRVKFGKVLSKRENTGTWPKCTACNSYHAPEGPCHICFNYNCPSHLEKDCRGVSRNVNPINARNLTVRASYECGRPDHVRPACPRLNRTQGPEENHPN